MHFGVVILPDLVWKESVQRWRRAEQMGFEHAWTYDHLSWRSFHDQPWFATVPTLTAAATATTRLRLGTLVASPNFRHPLTFAKDMVALDDISGGRAIAGIGSGGQGWDATVMGHPAWSRAERARRFTEFVTLTDLLLRSPAVTWRGAYYAVNDARTYPGCVQRPRLPLALAASGAKSMLLAARHGDFWVTVGPSTDQAMSVEDSARYVAAEVGRLAQACAEVGREPASVRRLVLTGLSLDPGLSSAAAFQDAAGRYQAAGATDLVVHWPRPAEPYAGDESVFETAISAALA